MEYMKDKEHLNSYAEKIYEGMSTTEKNKILSDYNEKIPKVKKKIYMFSILAVLFFALTMILIVSVNESLVAILPTTIIATIIFSLVQNVYYKDYAKYKNLKDKELILYYIKNERNIDTNQIYYTNKIDETELKSLGFKEVEIKTLQVLKRRKIHTFLINEKEKKFAIKYGNNYTNIYNFEDVIKFDVIENKQSILQSKAGDAFIGGLLFGEVGAIIGASGVRSIIENCNELRICIRLNSMETPEITITYLENQTLRKDSSEYKIIIDNIRTIVSYLNIIVENKLPKQKSKVSKIASESSNAKKELKELKEMLDDGLITQEDYEKKKKDILGI